MEITSSQMVKVGVEHQSSSSVPVLSSVLTECGGSRIANVVSSQIQQLLDRKCSDVDLNLLPGTGSPGGHFDITLEDITHEEDTLDIHAKAMDYSSGTVDQDMCTQSFQVNVTGEPKDLESSVIFASRFQPELSTEVSSSPSTVGVCAEELPSIKFKSSGFSKRFKPITNDKIMEEMSRRA